MNYVTINLYCYQETQEYSISKQILGWAHLLPESATSLAPGVTTRGVAFTRLRNSEKRKKRMSWKGGEKGVREGVPSVPALSTDSHQRCKLGPVCSHCFPYCSIPLLQDECTLPCSHLRCTVKALILEMTNIWISDNSHFFLMFANVWMDHDM